MSMNPFFEDIVIEMSGTGPTGKTGNSIASIEKTGASGLVDTYTITMSWGQTYTFEVTNGNGIKSITKTGTQGLEDEYTILFDDGDSTTFTVTNGEAATVSVGTVTTGEPGTNASVTNSGDDHNAVFDFVIPRGDTGDPGTYVWGDITGTLADQTDLQNALDAKADASDVYTKTQMDDALDLKADKADSYTKDELDGIFDGIDNALDTKADASNVYTKAQADTLLSAKANIADLGALATKDTVDYETEVTNKPTLGTMAAQSASDFYTDTEVDTLLSAKADSADLGTMSAEDASDYYDKTATDALLSEKADIIHTSASGSLVHITDGAAYPVDSLSVSIDPVQDLHGYDAPWPAGGGKNILPLTLDEIKTYNGNSGDTTYWDGNVYHRLGIVYTFETYQGYITKIIANGTASGNATLVLTADSTHNEYVGKICSGCPSGGGGSSYSMGGYDFTTGSGTPNDSGSGFTLSGLTDHVFRLYAIVVSGYTANNVTFQPMIRDSAQSTSYAPYANVCPISGHSSAVVTRTGKNLWQFSANQFINSAGTFSNSDTNARSDYIRVEGGSTIVGGSAKGQTLSQIIIGFYDAYKNFISRSIRNSDSVYSVTVPNNCAYCVMSVSDTSLTTFTEAIATQYEIQLELGSTLTTYESPHVQTVTIALGDTYYGAQLDVLTGTLTVDRVSVTWNSKTGWNYRGSDGIFSITSNVPDYKKSGKHYTVSDNAISNWTTVYDQSGGWADTAIDTVGIYSSTNNNDHVVYIRPSGGTFTTLDELDTYLSGNPLQVVFTLATPTVITGLTPAQMSLLLGENNVWADTGDTEVGYRADTKLYIERLTQPTEDDMVANTNIASGKYFMVGMNLFLSTSSIASGEAIVPGTNCTALSLADALNNLA